MKRVERDGIQYDIDYDSDHFVMRPTLPMTGVEFYSACKENWREDDDLIRLEFCLEAITLEFCLEAITPWHFLTKGGWRLEDRHLLSEALFDEEIVPPNVDMSAYEVLPEILCRR